MTHINDVLIYTDKDLNRLDTSDDKSAHLINSNVFDTFSGCNLTKYKSVIFLSYLDSNKTLYVFS